MPEPVEVQEEFAAWLDSYMDSWESDLRLQWDDMTPIPDEPEAEQPA